MQSVSFFTPGVPVPQGSKQGFVIHGKHGARPRAILVDAGKAKTHLKPWRQSVYYAAAQALLRRVGDPWDCARPMIVEATYLFARPKSHFGSKNGAPYLKASAPRFHTNKPDIDKLERSTLDALTGITFNDDCQVYALRAMKLYVSGDEKPGLQVSVTSD